MASTLLSSPSLGTTAKASSVLNNNAKLYGANNALDHQNESSCWNSEGRADGNTEHSFVVYFNRHVQISCIGLQFQGGFVAEECTLYTTKSIGSAATDSLVDWVEIQDAYIEPENVNHLQMFHLKECRNQEDLSCVAIKLIFKSSTDFYGRVILYKIEVHGKEMRNLDHVGN